MAESEPKLPLPKPMLGPIINIIIFITINMNVDGSRVGYMA